LYKPLSGCVEFNTNDIKAVCEKRSHSNGTNLHEKMPFLYPMTIRTVLWSLYP